MNVHVYFVPPGGGEADFGLDMETDIAPRVGEYMTIKFTDREQPYYGAFHVLYVSHEGEVTESNRLRLNKLEIQLEPVRHGIIFSGYWHEQLKGWEQDPAIRDLIKDYPNSGY